MNVTTQRKETVGYGRIDIEGRVVMIAGPDVSRVEGAGFTAARAGAGDYTITPINTDGTVARFEGLVKGTATIFRASAAYVDDDKLETFWDATAGVFHVLCSDISGAALDDLAADSGFSFSLTFRNSTVTP